MRRGKLNNISLILVLIVALFTLVSFVFDQLVVQTENKIRDIDFEYERSFNTYLRAKGVLFNTNDLMYRAKIKHENFMDRSEILEKAIYNIKFNKNYFEDNFNDKFDSDFNKNLEIIFLNRYKSMYLEIFDEASDLFSLSRGLPIRAMDESIFSSNNQQVLDSMMNLEKILNSNIEYYEKYKEFEKKDIINFNDYLDLRSNLRNFLNYYSTSHDSFQKIYESYSLYYSYYGGKTEEFLNSLNEYQNRKNFYILLSVLAQILSLFFLLILFKTLLNIMNHKKNI